MSDELTKQLPGVPVPVAELAAARKELSDQVRAVVSAAQDLEQLALIEETPFEEALLLTTEEVRKRYTGENARQIEWRRKACVELLAMNVPSNDIGRILSMNHRTVEAIASQEGQKIAAFSETHVAALVSSAMADIALADTRRSTAGHKDLHIAAGIKLTHAQSLKLLSAGNVDEGNVIQLEEENPKLVEARKFLEARKTKTT
jgi:hypothetical protein